MQHSWVPDSLWVYHFPDVPVGSWPGAFLSAVVKTDRVTQQCHHAPRGTRYPTVPPYKTAVQLCLCCTVCANLVPCSVPLFGAQLDPTWCRMTWMCLCPSSQSRGSCLTPAIRKDGGGSSAASANSSTAACLRPLCPGGQRRRQWFSCRVEGNAEQ